MVHTTYDICEGSGGRGYLMTEPFVVIVVFFVAGCTCLHASVVRLRNDRVFFGCRLPSPACLGRLDWEVIECFREMYMEQNRVCTYMSHKTCSWFVHRLIHTHASTCFQTALLVCNALLGIGISISACLWYLHLAKLVFVAIDTSLNIWRLVLLTTPMQPID